MASCHFGFVVDGKKAVRKALAEAGVKALPRPFLDFRNPWGNCIEIVGYDNVQFSKAPDACGVWADAPFQKREKAWFTRLRRINQHRGYGRSAKKCS